ncbi:hypothetical protein GCM10029992_66170 [Glycomyces albus]
MPKRNPLSRCAALGAVVVLALTGCNGQTGTNGEEAPEDRLALSELGDRLDGAVEHAYTAEYLAEGTDKTVTVAVDPEGAGPWSWSMTRSRCGPRPTPRSCRRGWACS